MSKILDLERLRTEHHDHLNPHGDEHEELRRVRDRLAAQSQVCLLYTSDAADDSLV